MHGGWLLGTECIQNAPKTYNLGPIHNSYRHYLGGVYGIYKPKGTVVES